MDPTDVALVLDRCDEVLASTSLRGHFVTDVPVDGFWPALGIAAIVVEGRMGRDATERLRELDAAGVKAVAIPGAGRGRYPRRRATTIERPVSAGLRFEIGTGELAPDSRFAPHGHAVVINVAGDF